MWIFHFSPHQQKTARLSVQSGGCRFAIDFVGASSNVSDQTDCPAGGGELRIIAVYAHHSGNNKGQTAAGQ
jgi:hypothetical protein